MTKGKPHRPKALFQVAKVLWHLDIFRRSFRDLSGHACMAESCIFCALKELFAQLQFSHETALPPDALRRALAESFFDQQRFQLGFMDDAAECFENMLLRIHLHIAQGEAEDMCNARHCIPHQKFAMTLVEQSICGACGATSEPLSFTQMVHYVSASALTTQVRQSQAARRPHGPPDTFGQLLQKAGSMGDIRDCPSSCGAKIQICRTLMNRPEIVSVGIVWDSERPTLEHIMDVFATLGTSLRLGDVFHSVVDKRWGDVTNHNLVGVVTYYGKHYSTFFFHTKLRVWIYFDDATVREVGPRWEQVVEKCKKGRYQPLLLLYAVASGTPVNTDNAPKQVTSFSPEHSPTKKTISQSLLRRSVTPSPEKPHIGNTRRAITPNPDCSPQSQKPPLPHSYSEYQNLSVIQSNLYGITQAKPVDVVDGDMRRMSPEYITRKSVENILNLQHKNQQVTVHRTNSSGSSSGVDMSVPEHVTTSRRRDSGNWSGDRNSASSSSSTTMDNPYLYLVGKIPHSNGNVPNSPTRGKFDSNGIYDAGYDSYSLSSNDSSTMSTIQHLMKMGHLAQIPEDYGNVKPQPVSPNCDVLCDEADELLVKSRQLEDEHDLVLALALCNAAATKARAAMNAPYNNQQTLTLARMKHNTCIMRARSLHRRMTQIQNPPENPPEIRHTREGSSSSGRHSRQNSRDKTQHSRQNSRELLVHSVPEKAQTKTIEIYATLPKKKDALKSKVGNINIGEDEEYIIYDKNPERESRSIFSRSKNKDGLKVREKRSRSEDRNKMTRDFSIAPEIANVEKEKAVKAEKIKNEKEEKKEKDGKNKKQHKIRRKLLMGGLIKRKNRSMPDLTEATTNNEKIADKLTSSVDDSSVGVKGSNNISSMCGYLSEGHLEFSGNTTNPNLERSRLMRKSFHGSAGKVLTAAKVPPPPPLRTTSQLTSSNRSGENTEDQNALRPQYPLPDDSDTISYYNAKSVDYNRDCTPSRSPNEPVSLPYLPSQNANPFRHTEQQNHNENVYDFNSKTIALSPNLHTIVTHADVHQEQSPLKQETSIAQTPVDDGVDEVDCAPRRISPQNLDLPPYPSPACSVVHSRQPSEDFPPPPPPLDLSALDEHLVAFPQQPATPPPLPSPDSLLAQLQDKRLQILSNDSPKVIVEPAKSGDVWLHELQAKQAALRLKKNQGVDCGGNVGYDEVNTVKLAPKGDAKVTSVRDLASKFENIQVQPPAQKPPAQSRFTDQTTMQVAMNPRENHTGNAGVLSLKKREEPEMIPAEQIADEIREVEMLNAAVQKTFNHDADDSFKKGKLGKKKSVSFCDQVILVATAEEQEDDSYIPNPILERVLRSAMNKPETAAIRQEIINLREASKKSSDTDSMTDEKSFSASPPQAFELPSLYRKDNPMENLPPRQLPNGLGHEPQEQEKAKYYGVARDTHYPAMQNQDVQRNQYVYSTPPQHNGQIIQRQSPYQQPPNYPHMQNQVQNRPPNFYPQNQFHQAYGSPKPTFQNDCHFQNQQHPQSAARISYNRLPLLQKSEVRQSPTLSLHSSTTDERYMSYGYQQQPPPQHPVYQHPPSPAPSNVSYTNGYSHNQQNYLPPSSVPNPIASPQDSRSQYSPYQRVPQPNEQMYQRVPNPEYNNQPSMNGVQYQSNQNHNGFVEPVSHYNNGVYQRVPHPDVYYQRGLPEMDHNGGDGQLNGKYSPYQHVFPQKHNGVKKSVSFEPGTKNGAESPTLKPLVTPVLVNNANNCVNVSGAKTKCTLCRKKSVSTPNSYCTDCQFYMSRFKPKC